MLGRRHRDLLLGFIKWTVIYRENRIAAARRWVPVLVALMAGIFAMYLDDKGIEPGLEAGSRPVVLSAGLAGIHCQLGWRPTLDQPALAWLGKSPQGTSPACSPLPLVFAAGLLSFAHGANDVANAVGPLAAIVAASQSGIAGADKVVLPFWVLLIGAVGISLGLALFGPRLIRTVGEKITKMDAIRAYCVALAAGITVLVASALGLPVSSTHIAVGPYSASAIFGNSSPIPAFQIRQSSRARCFLNHRG